MTRCTFCHGTGQLIDIDNEGAVTEIYLCLVCGGVGICMTRKADSDAVHD